MNKNKFLDVIFYSLNSANLIFIILNFALWNLSLYIVLALFLFLNSIYLLLKFVVKTSDSGLFFGTTILTSGIFLILTDYFSFSLMQLGAFILLAFTFACLMVSLFFKSVKFLYAFLSNFLMFFPTIFYSFHIIDLKLFFIFVGICVIINLILYFVLIKNVKRA